MIYQLTACLFSKSLKQHKRALQDVRAGVKLSRNKLSRLRSLIVVLRFEGCEPEERAGEIPMLYNIVNWVNSIGFFKNLMLSIVIPFLTIL